MRALLRVLTIGVLTIGVLADRVTGRRLGVLVVRLGPASFTQLADLCLAGEIAIHVDHTFGLDGVA